MTEGAVHADNVGARLSAPGRFFPAEIRSDVGGFVAANWQVNSGAKIGQPGTSSGPPLMVVPWLHRSEK
jgi:hypothetical protein